MARVLVAPEWYVPRAQDDFSGSDFNKVLESFAQILFPTFHFASFDMTIEARGQTVQPNFVLVAHDESICYLGFNAVGSHENIQAVREMSEVSKHANLTTYESRHANQNNSAIAIDALTRLARNDQLGSLIVTTADCEEIEQSSEVKQLIIQPYWNGEKTVIREHGIFQLMVFDPIATYVEDDYSPTIFLLAHNLGAIVLPDNEVITACYVDKTVSLRVVKVNDIPALVVTDSAIKLPRRWTLQRAPHDIFRIERQESPEE